ncbi:T6SS phospholipase effector Tle1-like catalytic domain-containing protein [Vogesella facilis]|uniref:T6SS phospholipase effector Tle1-like catalytic domain-containing protein n=1 Tax=Vogesella facilis TaxID=1655232 RepID=A0ABV7RBA7_9NEIS
MTARFAEYCRSSPLKLEDEEVLVARRNERRPSPRESLTCQQDIFIGVFFDGTGNNKYRDTAYFKHSNVARLYEAYAGAAFAETPSLGKGGGAKAPDLPPVWPRALPAEERPYYRKFYVPGLGTPFPELGDESPGFGGGFALYGDDRLDWALLQLANHVHAALLGGKTLTSVLGEKDLINIMEEGDLVRGSLIERRSSQLAEKIAPRLKLKPGIRSVRLSVFGFSRGAALARAFCNRVQKTYNGKIGGLRLEIDFLGIFDTVASVGLPNSTPLGDGEIAWADKPNLLVQGVRRCVHLVAAHEVRGSFPLSGSGSSGFMKEVVYPGAHSDVGGGYVPGEQGRSIGTGAVGDAMKLSQIPLTQMYREALIAGVPLIPADEMRDLLKKNFVISGQTIAAFNAYIKATSQGEGKPDKVMWLTETQPPRPLKVIMHEQWGFYLRWRKSMLGKVHQLPGLSQSGSSVYKQKQEINDIRVADEEIRLELKDIQDEADDWVKSDKYKEWAVGVQKEWDAARPVAAAEKQFFESLVHDSRAGFTPWTALQRDDDALNRGAVPSNQQRAIKLLENHLAYMKNLKTQSPNQTRLKKIEAAEAKHSAELARLKSGQSVKTVSGGHESYSSWGYLRWRVIL